MLLGTLTPQPPLPLRARGVRPVSCSLPPFGRGARGEGLETLDVTLVIKKSLKNHPKSIHEF
jgi:hypothetical protein